MKKKKRKKKKRKRQQMLFSLPFSPAVSWLKLRSYFHSYRMRLHNLILSHVFERPRSRSLERFKGSVSFFLSLSLFLSLTLSLSLPLAFSLSFLPPLFLSLSFSVTHFCRSRARASAKNVCVER